MDQYSRRRALQACSVGVGATVAGCVFGNEQPGDDVPMETDESPTETETKTATSHGTTYDCEYALHLEKASERQKSEVNETLEYEDLPEERQREVEEGVSDWEDGGGGTVELGDELPSTWSEERIVQYQGEQYHTIAATC